MIKRQSSPKSRLGLTLIEALVVIALIVAAAAMTVPFAGRSLGGRKVAAAAELVTDSLRQAQAAAMSGRAPKSFGVHFEPDRFTYFSGSAFNPADSENDVHRLDDDIGLTLSLTGGATDVVFDNHRGLPSVSGTVTATAADGGQYRIVTVGPEGAIGQ